MKFNAEITVLSLPPDRASSGGRARCSPPRGDNPSRSLLPLLLVLSRLLFWNEITYSFEAERFPHGRELELNTFTVSISWFDLTIVAEK